MALTYSSMLDLQTELINFNLHNVVDNNTFSSSEFNISKPALIMFICNHCPYVIHYHDEIKKLALDYLDRFKIGFSWLNGAPWYKIDNSPEWVRRQVADDIESAILIDYTEQEQEQIQELLNILEIK